ncbi:hypothetical protein A7A08_02829 [Methyloligella halotolerans]|uniref:DUF962 domain-containing protein n=1 Tax=Methyloligella halotolerans TaxID=1177755 RepID=A0A1E2RVK1_9HYPH|nr:DUF962 domain-containing protein [Methyloligella halotolerans]ODA66182.1 hypothetical protein A7A08_02829 [Methyloligella halotolerans]
MSDRVMSYDDFWQKYLRDHGRSGTRALHFLGTTLAVVCLAAAAITFRPGLVVLALVLGYGFAWFGHFVIEKNKPTMFGHPFWSFASDFRMTWLWYTGRLGEELARAGVSNDELREREEQV